MACFCFPKILAERIVILGCAPLDWRLLIFSRALKHSKVIYHTSWLCWDGSKYAKQPKLGVKLLKKRWQTFLSNRVSHIAVVTPQVKNQLCEHLLIASNKITVVYHSFDDEIFNFCKSNTNKTHLNILFVGRLLPEKGIYELLELTKQLPECNFTIIGKGKLGVLVSEIAEQQSNLTFLGFIANREHLAAEYSKADILLQPSLRSKDWEELFGMAIIEGMACGTVAVTTDHIGPKTIFESSYLSKNIVAEKVLIEEMQHRVKGYISDPEQLISDQAESAKLAQTYGLKEIAMRWSGIFREI